MLTAETIEQLIRANIPHTDRFDFRVRAVDDTTATCVLKFHPNMVRPGGTLSGPTIMTLCDAAIYALILKLTQGELLAVTSDLQFHFLRKAPQADLIAQVRLLKQGKKLIVSEVDVYSAEAPDKIVAKCTGGYAVP